MKYTSYGDTGLKVSAIGFGGMRFDMTQDESRHIDLVRYAFSRGINYFDTAPGYCDDQSEIIFGKALKTLDRSRFVISTKLMPSAVKTAQDAYEQICRSRDRLQVDTIDIFHAWCFRNLSHFDDCMRPDGLYEAMLRAQQEGIVRHLAFSTHLTGNGMERVIASGKFAGVLMGANILNFPYRLSGIRAARARHMGTVAMNPLHGGLIPKYEQFFQFLSQHGESPTLAALRFMVAWQDVDVTLNGFTTPEHIDMACEAADSAGVLTAEALEQMTHAVRQNMPDFCTGCGYCKACPAHVPVAGLMQFYNQKLLAGYDDATMTKYLDSNRKWGFLTEYRVPAMDCLHCGGCERACTQHLPIMSRLEEIARWEQELKEHPIAD